MTKPNTTVTGAQLRDADGKVLRSVGEGDQ